MSKIKFTRETTDKNGKIHIEATDGNEIQRNREIEKIKKDFAKPVDTSKVLKADSFWRSNAKVVTEAFPFSRVPAFGNPESLYECAKAYFIECDNTPFLEGKRTEYDKPTGSETKEDFIEKKQVYTLTSFLNYAGIQTWQWYDIYKKHSAFSDVIDFIERTIADDKYKGAVAGFYNATIVSRDLGLVEKSKIESDEKNDDAMTIKVEDLTETELDNLIKVLQAHSKVKDAEIIE